MADAPSQAGFEIEGRFYPFPDSFTLGDPVLVTELTGMPFSPDFIDAVNDEERRSDPVVLIGLVGVAVWRLNPRWPRQRVVQYVSRVNMDAFEAVGGEDDDENPPAEPAVEPATHVIPEPTPSSSENSSDVSAETSNEQPVAPV